MTATLPELKPSAGIQDIASRAMLVGIHLTGFNPVRTDTEITEAVAKQHNASSNAGKYAKNLIEKKHLEPLNKLRAEIGAEHRRRTLPWSEDGSRILTATGFDSYAAFVRQSEERWNAEVAQFLAKWDDMVSDARVALNGMFKEADYPTRSAVEKKFSFRSIVRPVPVADDFRVALGAAEVSSIRQSLQAELSGTIETAMREVFTQMHEVVSKMADRLKKYDPENPRETTFRETLVSNVADLVEILPSLNLANDPNVARFTLEMRALTHRSAQELKDSAWKRDDVAARAQSIVDQMAQFIA